MSARTFAVSCVLLLTACAPKVAAPSTEEAAAPVTDPRIEVTFPKPGDTLTGNVQITGQARGTWYFEASFPVQLLDASGMELLSLPAQADGEWMTEDFVPFHADITVPAEASGKGTLVLKKDNPSGLPENDAEVRIPVLLNP
ncbi:Gmad2 immunoglobulin-like domain-containing protein [Candidatus Peregrinibacteria bacterium]|nr:Gmad2 immunoglobulin-like domain-containing protein [Candidatus Peregrinibacteria bacterium]